MTEFLRALNPWHTGDTEWATAALGQVHAGHGRRKRLWHYVGRFTLLTGSQSNFSFHCRSFRRKTRRGLEGGVVPRWSVSAVEEIAPRRLNMTLSAPCTARTLPAKHQPQRYVFLIFFSLFFILSIVCLSFEAK